MNKKWLFLLVIALVIIPLLPGCATGETSQEPNYEEYNNINDPTELGWVRMGVVLDLGESGAYDDKNIESPIVLKNSDGAYTMWYRGVSTVDKYGRLMRAVSDDGIHWTKTGVVMTPEKSYEGNRIDPMTVMYEDGIYKMWYGGEEDDETCACYATSEDGIDWTRYDDNPVLDVSKHSWDDEGAGGQHCVVRTETGYMMIYKGYGEDADGWAFYALATSDNGIKWKKKGKVISPEPELGETTLYRNLHVVKIGDTYCLFHTMVEHFNLFLITSEDGVDWYKRGAVFNKALTPGGWDAKWSTSPWILVEGDKVRMWYEGGDINGRVRTLYAEVSLSELTGKFNTWIIPNQAQ
jgi:predicted GH43/DUF377 family glycosyl hydrolase